MTRDTQPSRSLVCVLFAALLTGCATDPGASYPWPYPGEPTAPESPTVPEPMPGAPSPWPEPELRRPDTPRDARAASGPAVVALLDKAEIESSRGELSQSAASIERALRIEPRNPYLWQKLASIRLEQGQPEQAEVLARKSIGLAQGNPWAEYSGWQRILEAREMSGDRAGVEEARNILRRLQRQID